MFTYHDQTITDGVKWPKVLFQAIVNSIDCKSLDKINDGALCFKKNVQLPQNKTVPFKGRDV